MQPRQRLRGASTSETCINHAVALQDHHSRSLDMSGTLNPCLPRHFARVRMTLAQREGLVPAPERSLTQQEWDAVHALAVRRSHCLDGGCAICLEEFGVRQQVLLSCAHVFHAACLTACEARTRERVCPVCRHPHYQKRTITDAALAHREASATRSGPPVSRTLRRMWAAGRLGASCVALQAMLLASSTTIDDLMQQVDAGLTQLRVGQAALQATGMAA